MGPKPGGGSPEIWLQPASQNLDLDDHQCRRRDLTPLSRIWASEGAGGTDDRPKPHLVKFVPAELWAALASDLGPVFPTTVADPQQNLPRVGTPDVPEYSYLIASENSPCVPKSYPQWSREFRGCRK